MLSSKMHSNRLRYFFLTALVLTLLAGGLEGCNRPETNLPTDTTGSPQDTTPDVPLFDRFLADIDTTADSLRQAKVDTFLALIDSSEILGFPLIEDSLAAFLYTGSVASVNVAGDFNGWNPDSGGALTHIAGTNLFYQVRTFPLEARLDYKYVLGQTWILDPRNPRHVTGGYGPNSELAMPGYVDPPEILRYGSIPHGTVENFRYGGHMMPMHQVQVYLPPGYADGDTLYPSIYVHDGGDYVTLASMVNVLDYCIAHDVCRPVIAVFVSPMNRNVEYWRNDDFRQWFVDDLVPYIDQQYRTIDDPARRAVMGSSLGGVVSVYFAQRNPEVFGLAAGQSSAFWIDDAVTIDEVEQDTLLSARFYLDVGTFEGAQQVTNHRRMRDILTAKGLDLEYHEYPEGHSWGNWRAHIDSILSDFFPAEGGEQ